MRIEKLYIKFFKNLQDLYIEFDPKQLTTVLLGRNGMGKSNLLEALVIIFRDLDFGEDPKFAYRITYHCRNRKIEIDADPDRSIKKIEIHVDGTLISLRRFSQAENRIYLPSNIFGYYSGPSNRLESHFDKHQDRFYKQLLNSKDRPLRPLFYARLIHSQFVLLAFFSFGDENLASFLQDYLGITGLEHVLFVLKEPRWYQKSKNASDFFWGARGVVRGFLDDLYSIALAPIKHEDKIYLYVRDLESLQSFAKRYTTNTDFFKTLESTYISELIDSIKIRVVKPGVTKGLTFSELSEGEQQLITVLGLLRFTKEAESLFLLDEPDTHLNPAWKLEYMQLIEKVVGYSMDEEYIATPNDVTVTVHNQVIVDGSNTQPKTVTGSEISNEKDDNGDSSQILLATHDPLVISDLKKEQVRVLSRKKSGKTVSFQPTKDPQKMGVPAILTSEVFGLRTVMGVEIQKKLDEKRRLTLKAMRDEISPDEVKELTKLSEEVGDLDFTTTIRDPLYSQFVNAMSEHEEIQKPVLTPEERVDQTRLAQQIVNWLQEQGE